MPLVGDGPSGPRSASATPGDRKMPDTVWPVRFHPMTPPAGRHATTSADLFTDHRANLATGQQRSSAMIRHGPPARRLPSGPTSLRGSREGAALRSGPRSHVTRPVARRLSEKREAVEALCEPVGHARATHQRRVRAVHRAPQAPASGVPCSRTSQAAT